MRLLLVGLVFSVSGCASNQYSVVYDSDPSGAEVNCGMGSLGYAPVEVYYELNDTHRSLGVMRPANCKFQWVSGAYTYSNADVDIKKNPDGARITVRRPVSVPGEQMDRQAAMYQDNARREQAQRYQQMQQQQEQMNRTTTTNCVTNFGFTTCNSF